MRLKYYFAFQLVFISILVSCNKNITVTRVLAYKNTTQRGLSNVSIYREGDESKTLLINQSFRTGGDVASDGEVCKVTYSYVTTNLKPFSIFDPVPLVPRDTFTLIEEGKYFSIIPKEEFASTNCVYAMNWSEGAYDVITLSNNSIIREPNTLK